MTRASWVAITRVAPVWVAPCCNRASAAAQDATSLQVADLHLDLVRRRVTRKGQRVDLTAKEFGLLELFMRRHGEVLPRTLIASMVWDINFDSDSNVIDVAVRRLRAKIDDDFSRALGDPLQYARLPGVWNWLWN